MNLNNDYINKITLGDSLELLKQLEDNSIDSVISDPPYGLEFMGKDWDSFGQSLEPFKEDEKEFGGYTNHIRYGKGLQAMINFQNWVTEWAAECYRVLKPGGFLVAFGGTRTFHRLAVGIENAGLQCKDTFMVHGIINWTYGTGFPKATDISKQLDKFKGISIEKSKEFATYLKSKREEANVSITEADNFVCEGTTNYSWFEGRPKGQRLPKPAQWLKIKEILKLDNEWDEFIGEAERTVVGKSKTNTTVYQKIGDKNVAGDIDVTIAATDIAKEWEGWKSIGLKPSYEPILIFMKPTEKGLSIAQNVVKWGTGAINVDGSRVSLNGEPNPTGSAKRIYQSNAYAETDVYGENKTTPDGGRFPANTLLIHHPLCEFKGIKKVVGNPQNPDKFPKNKDIKNDSVVKFGRGTAVDRTDENGLEEVEDWQCHSDCMVRALGNQSGEAGAIAPVMVNDKRKGFGGKGIYNKYEKGGDDGATFYQDKGTAARFFKQFEYDAIDFVPFYYTAKANKRERNLGFNKTDEKFNNHPTVKPVAIMKYLVNMFTKPGYIVMDPFMGSGTTAVACVELDRNFIGFEKNEEYKVIADSRIEYYKKQKDTQQEGLF